MNGKIDNPKKTNNAPIVIALCFKHQPKDFAYALSTLSKKATTVRSYHVFLPLSSMSLPFLTHTFFACNNLEHNIGVNVIAITVDVQHTTVTIHPSDSNMIPAIPSIIVNGTNTAASTKVVAMTLIHTSFVA